MNIKYACPECAAVLTLPEEHLGKWGTCNKCGKRVFLRDMRVVSPACRTHQEDGPEAMLAQQQVHRHKKQVLLGLALVLTVVAIMVGVLLSRPATRAQQEQVSHDADATGKERIGYLAAVITYISTVIGHNEKITRTLHDFLTGGNMLTILEVRVAFEDAQSLEYEAFHKVYSAFTVLPEYVRIDAKVQESHRLLKAAYDEVLQYWKDANKAHLDSGGLTLQQANLTVNECAKLLNDKLEAFKQASDEKARSEYETLRQEWSKKTQEKAKAFAAAHNAAPESEPIDDAQFFISKYGPPDSEDSTEHDVPQPALVTRSLTYQPEHLQATYILVNGKWEEWEDPAPSFGFDAMKSKCFVDERGDYTDRSEPSGRPYKWKLLGFTDPRPVKAPEGSPFPQSCPPLDPQEVAHRTEQLMKRRKLSSILRQPR